VSVRSRRHVVFATNPATHPSCALLLSTTAAEAAIVIDDARTPPHTHQPSPRRRAVAEGDRLIFTEVLFAT
jgi:hypothetical protein